MNYTKSKFVKEIFPRFNYFLAIEWTWNRYFFITKRLEYQIFMETNVKFSHKFYPDGEFPRILVNIHFKESDE